MEKNIVEKLYSDKSGAFDSKHILNLANIPVSRHLLDKIENGIDIEDLSNVALPICIYETQITIHGLFPEQQGIGYVNGYKNIFQNKNKSIGIRYSAIDAAKKKTLKMVCYEAKHDKRSKWICSESSTGYKFVQYVDVHDIDAARLAALDFKALFSSVPKDLFYGRFDVAFVRDVYGRKWVEANIFFGAIPKENLEQFAMIFFKMTILEAENLTKERQDRYEREALERKRESENNAVKRLNLLEKFRAENHDKIISVPKKSCTFIRVYVSPYDDRLKRGIIKAIELKNGKLVYHRIKSESEEVNTKSKKTLIDVSRLNSTDNVLMTL